MQSPREEMRRATAVMVFAVVSSLVVVAISVGVIVVIGNLVARLAQPARDYGPYNIAARRNPMVSFVGDLLPPVLGDFTRQSLEGDLQKFRAVYTNGAERILVEGSQAVSLAAAQASVKLVRERDLQANSRSLIESSRLGFAFYTYSAADRARLAYSRDRWFFDILASSQRTLDAFMSVFQH
ncbi:MAG: hypothetical protein RML95_12395 [Anaerolineae bacterium]|nr:hypothetical protein [Anaerolineae bacterium]